MANAARQAYWGIPCPSCGKMIAFAEVKYDPVSAERVDPNPIPNPFLEECPHCGSPNTYSAQELLVFEGPATVGFIPHEAFSGIVG